MSVPPDTGPPATAPPPGGAPRRLVLVTGATGYVGGRLVPRLLEQGYRVRCLARSPRKLSDRPWSNHPAVEVVRGDLLDGDREALERALAGVHAAYYLVHAMISAGEAYAETDRRMAESFAAAAAAARVERIVYLGGLGEMGAGLSEHLTSRLQVGRALASGPVPVTELRAAMIIGSGSASFEVLRYLVERLPVMVTPKWVRTRCEPIAIDNVLGYLVQCLQCPETTGRALDIGGGEVKSYRRIMAIMAQERGLRRRWVIPVPVLTPRLSSLWIHLVTPLTARIARPLAEGLRNEVVVQDGGVAGELMPQRLLGIRESIRAALDQVASGQVETAWSMAGPIPGDPDWAGGTCFEDRREAEIDAPPEAVFRAVCRVGGGHGWYAADWLWRLRGWMDLLVGGPGLRRGRRNPERVSYGEALDFWRVTGLERGKGLTLRAEMKVPGEALLDFSIEPVDPGSSGERTRLVQTARFLPKGLLGLAYWYAVVPFHHIVFSGMLRGICRAAEEGLSEPGKAGVEPAV